MMSHVTAALAAYERGSEAVVKECLTTAADDAAPLDRRPDLTGLDDGPYLPGQGPRKQPAPKSPEELAEIRAKAWATRRKAYGPQGHR